MADPFRPNPRSAKTYLRVAANAEVRGVVAVEPEPTLRDRDASCEAVVSLVMCTVPDRQPRWLRLVGSC